MMVMPVDPVQRIRIVNKIIQLYCKSSFKMLLPYFEG